jgi:hypothetical protein
VAVREDDEAIPHEYVVQRKVDEVDFQAMVAHIKEHGYRARWRHLPANSYLELDGWRDWVMPGRRRQLDPGPSTARGCRASRSRGSPDA